MKKFVLYLLLTCVPGFGLETDKAAHLGTSYAIQTATYGLAKKAFRMKRTDAVIFSAFATFLIGFTKEVLDSGKYGKLDAGDIAANALGQGLAVGTIFMFEF